MSDPQQPPQLHAEGFFSKNPLVLHPPRAGVLPRAPHRRSLPGCVSILAAILLVLLTGPDTTLHAAAPATTRPAPEFTQQDPETWINSPPLRLADLRGKVVLLDVWTFDCWNCYRSFPWLIDLEQRLGPLGLQVVGIHSPEFKHEHERAGVERKAAEFGLHHPIMMDNDFAYWRALGNRYWPTFYVLDRAGQVRGTFIGETHAGDRRARRIDTLLQELLAEQAP